MMTSGNGLQDQKLAEELIAQSRRWGILPNWHTTAVLVDMYVTNKRPEKAISFMKYATECAPRGTNLLPPVRCLREQHAACAQCDDAACPQCVLECLHSIAEMVCNVLTRLCA